MICNCFRFGGYREVVFGGGKDGVYREIGYLFFICFYRLESFFFYLGIGGLGRRVSGGI